MAERHELFVYQGFDRAGINRTFPLGEAHEVEGLRHEGLAGARGRLEDDIVPREYLQDGVFLGRIEFDPATCDEVEETPKQGVVVRI